MIFANSDVRRETDDEAKFGVHHRHAWALVTSEPELVTAERMMGWDRSKSRIVGINRCTFCAGLHRNSTRECSARHCRAHAICASRG